MPPTGRGGKDTPPTGRGGVKDTPPTGGGRKGYAPYRRRKERTRPQQEEGTPPPEEKQESTCARSPEKKHEGLEEGPKVIVLSDLELILITVLILHVDADVAKHLGNRKVMNDQGHPCLQWLQGNSTQPSWLSLQTGFP